MATVGQRRWYRRIARTALVTACVAALVGTQVSSNAEEGPYPGLGPLTGVQWTGAAQTGIAHSTKTAQWMSVPLQAMAVDLDIYGGQMPPSEVDWPGEFECVPWQGTQVFENTTVNKVYLVSPEGAETPYGTSLPIQVRTVAFGSIPVEATVQVEQSMRPDGTVDHIELAGSDFGNCRATIDGTLRVVRYLTDAHATAGVRVRVTDLAVDGHDLGLAATCQTSDLARLELFGKGGLQNIDFPESELNSNSREYYAAAIGGRLNGTLDIGPFAGCVTSDGEDISELLTGMVSSSDNPVALQVTGPDCPGPVMEGVGLPGPPPPGGSDPAEWCYESIIPEPLELPSR